MLTRLIVLGLLSMRAMSGYEMQRYLQLSRTDLWAGILPGSIYHALKKLAEEGVVVLETTEHSGNRTSARYAITPAGKVVYVELLQDAWSMPSPHFPTSIYVAVMFAGDLSAEGIITALDQHIAAIAASIAEWTLGEALKSELVPEPMRPLQAALFANGRAHFAVDLEFLQRLRDLIQRTSPTTVTIPPLEEHPK